MEAEITITHGAQFTDGELFGDFKAIARTERDAYRCSLIHWILILHHSGYSMPKYDERLEGHVLGVG